MRCNDFQERLHVLLDQRRLPSDDQELSSHAFHCNSCGEVLAVTESMLWAMPKVSANEACSTASGSLVPSVCLVATAATLLVSLFVWPLLTPRGDHQPVAERNASPEASIESVQHAARMANTEANTPSSLVYQPLISLSLLTRADWSGIEAAQMPFASHVPSVETEWLRVVADGMTPVQESMNSTLQLIRRSLSPSIKTVAANG